MKHKKTFTILALILLLFFSVLPTSAAPKTNKQVKKTVTDFFKYSKKYDIKKIRSCFAEPQKVDLFDTKKYMRKFVKSQNKKISYKILSIKAGKETATVKVKCKYYNAYSAYKSAMDDVVLYSIFHPNASSSEIDKYQYNRTYYYQYENEEYFGAKYSKKVIVFKLQKINGKWKISSFSDAMNNAIHCNYLKAYKNYFKD